jgi:hypothetical protein
MPNDDAPNYETKNKQNTDTDASIQQEGGQQDQCAKKYNLYAYVAQGFYWLTIPIRWFYSLDPIEKFTAVLCVVGAIQTWAFIQSERAFLSWSGMNFEGGKGIYANKQIVLMFDIKNNGRATANIKRLHITITDNLPTIPKYNPLALVFAPIAPNVSASNVYRVIRSDGTPFILNEAQVEAIKMGKLMFAVYGVIEYDDEYSLFSVRKTGFCFMLDPIASPDGSAFVACREPAYTYAH